MCKTLFQQVETVLVTPKVLQILAMKWLIPQIFIVTITFDLTGKKGMTEIAANPQSTADLTYKLVGRKYFLEHGQCTDASQNHRFENSLAAPTVTVV